MKRLITLAEVNRSAMKIAEIFPNTKTLYGIPRGGIPAALAVANFCKAVVVDDPNDAEIIIDDIWDTGATMTRYTQLYKKPGFVLFDKRTPEYKNKWLVLPWEQSSSSDESATDNITRLLQFIGEDPTREGLRDTPARVIKAWSEWATGYGQDPADILKTFEDGAANYDEMVIVHNIPVVSKCEHHLADVIGHAHVGYIPNNRIVGLSKLARLVDAFARRLQVQERMTTQIADALVEHLSPLGVGVLIRASHACMSTRGVKVQGSTTTTSAMRGVLLDKSAARKEFLDLCKMAELDR